jgi:NitT/TauT family transport system substrate-binding protein
MLRLLLALGVALAGLACAPAAAPSKPAPAAPPAASAPSAPAQPGSAAPAAPAPPGGARAAPTSLPQRTIVMAIPATTLSVLPAKLADEQGFFRAEGIEVDWRTFAPQLTISAVVADEADYSSTPSSGASAASQGAPVKIVQLMTGRLQHALLARSDLTSISDLAGKRIAVNRHGDVTMFEARWLIDQYNLADVSVLSLGLDTQRMAGVLSGAADATVLPVPVDIMAERQGLRTLLAMSSVLEVPISGLVANEQKIRRHPDEIAALARALVRGTQYLRDPASSSAIAAYIANWADLSPDEGRIALDRVRDTYLVSGVPTDTQFKNFLEMLAETGAAAPGTPIEQVADFTIARRVAAEMGVGP